MSRPVAVGTPERTLDPGVVQSEEYFDPEVVENQNGRCSDPGVWVSQNVMQMTRRSREVLPVAVALLGRYA